MRKIVYGGLVGILSVCSLSAGMQPTKSAAAETVAPSDFQYIGAFRLPLEDNENNSFAYGGHALTFRPDGDPKGAADGFPGSLFLTGHPYQLPLGRQVAEITIPKPVKSKKLGAIPKAKLIQPLANIAGETFKDFNELPRVALHYLKHPATGPKIHIAFGQHMGLENVLGTHGLFDPKLSAANFAGPWKIADHQSFSVNGYMFEIPGSWAKQHVQGRVVATGRFRDGGWSGMGPVILAYKPWNDEGKLPKPGEKLTTTVLLKYQSSQDAENIERCLDGYQHPDEWEGGAWLTTSSGKSAVLFAGTKSTGRKYWYGYANPKGPQYLCMENASSSNDWACKTAASENCPDSDRIECEGHNDMRGWRSNSFEAQFILYDPKDLAKVAAGEMKPHEPQPYARVRLDKHLFLNVQGNPELGSGVQRRYRIGATAYDREHNLLYVMELHADGAKPVIHVWKVD